jgi:hypothetical protein
MMITAYEDQFLTEQENGNVETALHDIQSAIDDLAEGAEWLEIAAGEIETVSVGKHDRVLSVVDSLNSLITEIALLKDEIDRC